MQQLIVVGLNHHNTPIELREKVSVGESELAGFNQALVGFEGVHEAMTLSTCNRVELYLVADRAFGAALVAGGFLARRGGVEFKAIHDHLYIFKADEALKQLFRVASSLDSMVLGEPQISGQLKAAFQHAQEAATVGPLLGQSVQRAFHVAKRVRTETRIGESPVSLSYLASEQVKEALGGLEGKQAALIGSGEMGALAARHLASAGAHVIIVNRSLQGAQALAEEVGGEAKGLDEINQVLHSAHAIIASTAAPHWIIVKEMIAPILGSRPAGDLVLVDLGLPRNIDPRVGELAGVELFDVDDLERVLDENRAQREAEASVAADIVENELAGFKLRMQEQQVKPAIVALRQHFEQIASDEMARFADAIELNAADRKLMDRALKAMVNKMLHHPQVSLKASARSGEYRKLMEVTTELFGLEEGPKVQPKAEKKAS